MSFWPETIHVPFFSTSKHPYRALYKLSECTKVVSLCTVMYPVMDKHFTLPLQKSCLICYECVAGWFMYVYECQLLDILWFIAWIMDRVHLIESSFICTSWKCNYFAVSLYSVCKYDLVFLDETLYAVLRGLNICKTFYNKCNYD